MTVEWTRREWLAGLGGAALWLFPGCARRWDRPGPRLRRLLGRASRPLPIVQWRLRQANPGSVLRKRALAARRLQPALLRQLDERLRETLKASGGVGLAAPQIDVARRVILVQRQDRSKQVLTCVDPRVVRRSPKTVDGYEACLSIQGVGGKVRRSVAVEVAYLDLAGQRRRHAAHGWEARIFQHEIDHLNGVLYIDRLVGPLLPIDEMRRRRRQRTESTAALPWLAHRQLEPGTCPL